MTSLAEAEAYMASRKAKAKEAFVAKNWPAARDLYTHCLEIHPEAVLYSNRSACFLELGEHASALADGDLALDLDPRFAKAQFRRGKALEGLRRLREAVAAYEAGLALEPESVAFASAAKRVRGLLDWLQDAPGAARDRASPAAAAEPAARDATPAPVQSKLEQDFVNKGACSYYYAHAPTRKAAKPRPEPAAATSGEQTVPVAGYSWVDKHDGEARIYLPFEAGDIAGLDAEADVDVRVSIKNWQCTSLDVRVRLARETRHLAIPQLYDKARFDRVIKKKAKLIVCLAKLEAAPWPQLTWDPKRNDEHRSGARGTGGYAAVRC